MGHSESQTRRVVLDDDDLGGTRVTVVVLDGHQRGESAVLTGGRLIIGRAPGADLTLDGDSAVSRHHCAIERRGPVVVIVDLGSANGTLVDGEPIDGTLIAVDGHVLEIGSTRLAIELDEERHEGHHAVPVASSALPVYPGYRTVERLGEGNMGSVVLAERMSDGALFAIKALHAEGQLDASDGQRFLREAASLRSLSHPNIIGFSDQGMVDGGLYLVMEYVRGVDLDIYRRQAGGYVPVVRCVELIMDVLDGLAYAHRKGFVHRDVKPANIIVGLQDGAMIPKLTDFGLAKRYSEAALDNVTRGKIALGTPDYMPPEQILSFRTVGPLSDIYSVGATIYHLLSGDPLYAGVAGPDPIRTLLQVDPPPLLDRAPWVPVSVAQTIQRAIRRAPDERWASAASFRDALKESLRHSTS
jgi:serine/threonine protein kinase